MMGSKNRIHQRMQEDRKRAQADMQEATVASVVPPAVQRKVKAKAATNGAVTLSGKLPTLDSLGIPRDARGRGISKGLGCLFSGQKKIRDAARFYPGNDARLTSLLVKVADGRAAITDVRPEALAFLQEPGGMAGFKIEENRLIRTHAASKPKLNEEMDES
jgi:hypothetical protein